jgi:hypothetical protein
VKKIAGDTVFAFTVHAIVFPVGKVFIASSRNFVRAIALLMAFAAMNDVFAVQGLLVATVHVRCPVLPIAKVTELMSMAFVCAILDMKVKTAVPH